MNRNEFESNWNQLKGMICTKWSKFTPDDVARINGKYEPFLGQLQKKYGYSREQAEMEIKNWGMAPNPKGQKVESIGSCDASCKDKTNPNMPKERRDQSEKKRKAG